MDGADFIRQSAVSGTASRRLLADFPQTLETPDYAAPQTGKQLVHMKSSPNDSTSEAEKW